MAPAAVQPFVAAFNEAVTRQRQLEKDCRKSSEYELAAIRRRIDGLVETLASGIRSSVTNKLAELEARQDPLLKTLQQSAPSPVRLHPNLAELYRRKVADLRAPLDAPVTCTLRR